LADQYITYPLVADARDLMQTCFDYMATQFPGWAPSEGQLDTAIIEAVGSEAADIASLTTEVPKSIFRYFGAKLMGVIPQDAVAATATTTWFATDTLGHIIPAGSQVSISDSDGNVIPFTTLSDIQIAAGSNQTSTGQVVIIAVAPGADSSGVGIVGGNIDSVDVFTWLDHIRQDTITTGGVDAESDDDYLNRLSFELSLNSPRPILPNDFAILALNADPTIQRATAIDGYNPADSTSGNQRMVTVVALDSLGVGVNSTIRTKIQTYLNSLRELNFIVNTTTPTVSLIDVTTTLTVLKSYAVTDVHDRVVTAIQDFLDPSMWGVDPSDDPNDPVSWINTTKVSYLELATAVNQVPGVALITALTLGLHGGGLSSADYTMTGVAPLPNPSTITVTAS
jgi:hypothetical protein